MLGMGENHDKYSITEFVANRILENTIAYWGSKRVSAGSVYISILQDVFRGWYAYEVSNEVSFKLFNINISNRQWVNSGIQHAISCAIFHHNIVSCTFSRWVVNSNYVSHQVISWYDWISLHSRHRICREHKHSTIGQRTVELSLVISGNIRFNNGDA